MKGFFLGLRRYGDYRWIDDMTKDIPFSKFIDKNHPSTPNRRFISNFSIGHAYMLCVYNNGIANFFIQAQKF